jgi:hypothetical protein
LKSADRAQAEIGTAICTIEFIIPPQHRCATSSSTINSAIAFTSLKAQRESVLAQARDADRAQLRNGELQFRIANPAGATARLLYRLRIGANASEEIKQTSP